MRFVQEASIVDSNQSNIYLDHSSDNSDNRQVFQDVYPFATEAVSAYFSTLDLAGKSLLTVGSSCDQAFNALVLGAKNITVYDINVNVEKFYKLKRDLILDHPREKLYDEVLKISSVPFSRDVHSFNDVVRMNNYLQSDENYELLRKRLKEDNVQFIHGDIFNFDKSLDDRKYDRIAFSNILQYLDFFAGSGDPYQLLAEVFPKWRDHLNDEGIMQLLYLYSFSRDDLRRNNHSVPSYNLTSIVSALDGHSLELEWIKGFSINHATDAIVTYTKKR